MRDTTVDDCMKYIDAATRPEVMSKASALDFLDDIETEVRARMEALRDEIRNER